MNEKEVIEQIESKIKRLNNSKILDFHEKENLKDAFFNKLFILDYTKDKKKRLKLIKEAKSIANRIPELKGWPENSDIFWDVESYSWENRINFEVRSLIKKELKKLKGKNLSLGSGSYPYVQNSTLVDISSEMLNFAPKKCKKVICNLEKEKLPFKNNSFDSVTLIFLLNYLNNPKKVLLEAKRVAKKVIIVQSKKSVTELYQIQERKKLIEIKRLLSDFKLKEKKVGNDILMFAENKP